MNWDRWGTRFICCGASILLLVRIVLADSPPLNSSSRPMRLFPSTMQDVESRASLAPRKVPFDSTPSRLGIDRRIINRSMENPTPLRKNGSLPSYSPCRIASGHLPVLTCSYSNAGSDKVRLCRRTPEIPLGSLMAKFGKFHQWLVVEDRKGKIVHAAGLGTGRGVPGANRQSSPDIPYTKTCIVDHRNEPSRDCKYLSGIDPQCVRSETPFGKPTGPWIPLINDCNTFVVGIMEKCDKNQRIQRGAQNNYGSFTPRGVPFRSNTLRSAQSNVRPIKNR
jgi:hypothetical protein